MTQSGLSPIPFRAMLRSSYARCAGAAMQRREFIGLIGSVAATWPPAARAQRPAMPVVGFLSFTAPDESREAAFRRGLQESGYVEGRNVAIEYRWAEDRVDRLPALATDLVRRQVSVIATASTPAALAAKAATTTIPIVFEMAGDPVRLGVVTADMCGAKGHVR
ncbi:MAG TPA: ABC transporter substrate binding protein [Pseudolabrys sp.]|nr:ABC transporter substrate binding protein [Pseudolabrys sp.]